MTYGKLPHPYGLAEDHKDVSPASQAALGALPGAAPAGASPVPISFARRRSAVRLIVVDAHQPEAVRAVRTPIVVRAEPYVPVIIRSLLVIPAERVAPRFGCVRVEEDPREVPPRGFNSSLSRAGALVRDHQDVKASLADRAFVGRRKDLIAVRIVMPVGQWPMCAEN
jgi:hypothetical protein